MAKVNSEQGRIDAGDLSESEINEFELRMRSFQPAPPQAVWQDLPLLESLQIQQREADMSLVARSLTARRSPHGSLPRIASHAVAILIGIGVGATWMAAFQPSSATDITTDIAIQQHDAQIAEQEQDNQIAESVKSRRWSNLHRKRSGSNFISGIHKANSRPLTPVSCLLDVQTPPLSQPRPDVVLPDDYPEGAESFTPDKPMPGPMLMRKLLDELAADGSSHYDTMALQRIV